MRESVDAVLFDLDGTLVDSNYAHVAAWSRALQTLGQTVPTWRVHRAIGKDARQLLASLVGERSDDWQERAKGLYSRFYADEASRLRALPGATDLVRAIAERHVKVVFATSAPQDQLDLLLGILDVDDAVDAVTSSADVDTAKPDPDIIHVALRKAAADPKNAIMIGDAVWDMQACARAGVQGIGVRTGGTSEADLREAGAADVFDDPRAVLDSLDGLLRATSLGSTGTSRSRAKTAG